MVFTEVILLNRLLLTLALTNVPLLLLLLRCTELQIIVIDYSS